MKYLTLILIVCLLSCSNSTKKSQNTSSESTDQVLCLKSNQVKLSSPILSIDSLIFKNSSKLELDFGLVDSKVFYKIDDGAFQPYLRPLSISKSCTLSYKAQKEGYQDSDISQTQLIKASNILEGTNLTITPPPHDNYPGNGAATLYDLNKGSLNFRANNAWCGFQSEKVELNLDFDSNQKISKVIVSILDDPNSWIFAPKKIQIIIDDQLIKEKELEIPSEASKANLEFLTVSFQETAGKNVKVIIENMEAIPDWHPGKGTMPWLFLDEILVE